MITQVLCIQSSCNFTCALISNDGKTPIELDRIVRNFIFLPKINLNPVDILKNVTFILHLSMFSPPGGGGGVVPRGIRQPKNPDRWELDRK